MYQEGEEQEQRPERWEPPSEYRVLGGTGGRTGEGPNPGAAGAAAFPPSVCSQRHGGFQSCGYS